MKRKYLVIYEWSGRNWGVYSPDVPGCVSTGETVDEAAENFKEALELYLEDTVDSGDAIPEPVSQAGYVEVEVPELVK